MERIDMPQEKSMKSFVEEWQHRQVGQRVTPVVKALASHLAQAAEKGQAPDTQAMQGMLAGLDENLRPIAKAHAQHLVDEARDQSGDVTQALSQLINGKSPNHLNVRRGAGRG
jgi:hypothetical protein